MSKKTHKLKFTAKIFAENLKQEAEALDPEYNHRPSIEWAVFRGKFGLTWTEAREIVNELYSKS